jgi:hypothetical protein
MRAPRVVELHGRATGADDAVLRVGDSCGAGFK